MKIAFVWWWERSGEIYPNWHDGLKAAIQEIRKEHEVVTFLDGTKPDLLEPFDFILFWDDSNSTFFNEVDKYKEASGGSCKIGLCLTTDPQNFDNLKKLDVVYCESDPVYDAVRKHGIRAIKAFGTDTDFYTPKDVEKDIEYFYPATFSPWKRQSELAYLGSRILLVGTVQPDGESELKECQDKGCKIEIGYFPAEKIRDYYQRTRGMIIPAIHGSERTMLEAMSCGLRPVVVHPENTKTLSYLFECGSQDARAFVLENYSHIKYARDLLKGMI